MAESDEPQEITRTGANAQAHLVRAAKVLNWKQSDGGGTSPAGYRTRDWSMFYFFRIMRDEEFDFLDSVEVAEGSAQGATRFRTWLKALVDGYDDDAGREAALHILDAAGGPRVKTLGANAAIDSNNAVQIADDLVAALIGERDRAALAKTYAEFLAALRLQQEDVVAGLLKGLNPSKRPNGQWALFRMVLFELIRQAAPPVLGNTQFSAMRAEANESKRDAQDELFDRTPINMSFTFAGLRELNLKPTTLASFPDAFKQGMAARAELLRDVGPSAPEHWEGELGLASVHGYFSSAADLEQGVKIPEAFWRNLRSEVRAFNDPIDDHGRQLRAGVKKLFALVGIEVLHIELGQDPYGVTDGLAERISPRREHFGFRDGLSQPYLDLGLEDGPREGWAGGGSPSRRSTWTPVALGEVFLDRIDETGAPHHTPCNKILRAGSTYLVFRKLEQDVIGLRNYLATQRPTEDGRKALSAQMVGRWPNGTSLVHSPNSDREMLGEAETSLNDFRYSTQDPLGRKCPLGAHVRRANPRDIGDRDNVRHHRILRRGISYGGRLLREQDADDGEKRGILFIAANASIDTQFEVIQGAWINGGEFQGQAGLGRCPIAGTREGREGSSFFEAGSGVPRLDLPQFVTTRGGDYFFLPGISALRGIVYRDEFSPDAEDPLAGLCTADASPVSPFAEDQVRIFSGRILAGASGAIRVAPRPGATTLGNPPPPIAFVAKHKDVTEVLCDKPFDKSLGYFSVAQIREAGLRITRGDEWPIGTDDRGPSAEARTRLWAVLNGGWQTLTNLYAGTKVSLDARLSQIVCGELETSLRRVASAGNIDLIDDFAALGAYGVVSQLYGLQGPAWLTEMAIALPFSRQHVGALPREWMAAIRGESPSDPRRTTMQIWTCVMTADLIANAQQLRELQILSRQAGSEMLNHIDIELAKARERFAESGGATQPLPTLIEAFIRNETDPTIEALYKSAGVAWQSAYYRDVAVILLEIASSTMAIIPFTFGQVMQRLIGERFDLCTWLPELTPRDLDMAIYEAERLNPNISFRLRRCEVDKDFGGQLIRKGDTVMALTGAAGMDPTVFENPARFSLGADGCPVRRRDDYLLFGVPAVKDSHKDCWGRNRVALPVLRECVRVAGRLRGLRRVAGPSGEPQKFAGVTIGLPSRFISLGPNLKLKDPPPSAISSPSSPTS